jgi:ketosteroid isomerase-like protein
MKKITALFCTSIIFIGCNRSPVVDTLAEAKAIRNLEDQWTVALQKSDADKIISFFTTEAVAMKPNTPILVGLQAIRKERESSFTDTTLLYKTYSSKIDIIEVSASGDLAYVRGTDHISIKTPNGLVDDMGKWVDIWKKIDGQWKVIVDIWNSDIPLGVK